MIIKNLSFRTISLLLTFLTALLFITACIDNTPGVYKARVKKGPVPVPGIKFEPEKYICNRAGNIIIDGILDEESWSSAVWTEDFVDIEGELKPEPLHRTRVKMLWDDSYLYIAAELYEPHIWAKLRQRDTVIFYDNDFEVFIDPDGDTHEYMEFEMNTLNTLWDLFLTRPYRDNGRVSNSWDIKGIKTAVDISGTINDPSDTDEKWVVELAFPLEVLAEFGGYPEAGKIWRINFSRVNWRTEIVGNNYVKAIDPETGKAYPEFNWVWSPQGVINMHYPEMWGYLLFSDDKQTAQTTGYTSGKDEEIKWNLRTLYYSQRKYAGENSTYSDNKNILADYGYKPMGYDPEILVKPTGYEAYIVSEEDGVLWTINNQGRVFRKNLE